jgi:hypothetical protein
LAAPVNPVRSADPNLPPSFELEAEKKETALPATRPGADRRRAPEDEVILAWRVHLGRRRPLHAIIAAAAILVVVGWSAVVFSLDKEGKFRLNPLPSLLFGLIMTAAMAELLFPVSYKLTRKGAYRRNFLSVSQIEWRNVRKCYLAADGVKLSPLRRQTRLEAFRGVFLRFGDGNRDEIIEKVKELRVRPRLTNRAAGSSI